MSVTVDWDLATATAVRLVPKGPKVSRADAHAAVAELRQRATEAQAHVRAYTGLVAEGGTSAVAVVDRPGWVRANVEGFRVVLDPLVARLSEKAARRRTGPDSPVVEAVGSVLTGLETGGLLAFLAGKVLGQYELFTPNAAGGRLLLVAPNIVAAERELTVDVSDFRLWVCLHEETHRVQFGASPWLRDHLLDQITGFVDDADLEPAALLARLRGVFRAVYGAVRGDERAPSLLEAVQSPAQREALDRVTAVMSLLEGHADVVMDGVGPDVVPSVEQIRKRFQKRRSSGRPGEQVLRRLIGIDAKMRQYRDGATFVRGVLDRAGMDGFNQVWAGPETLPLPAEIADPAAWVKRVL
ncbi:zinc-dependent metalloprotease [Motilibacter aurantiacus]|uniref:zinc-dependent metalloprotease n=1 Tax=Motilibacter aurantiacus TaxID=2714955 RepID=UPI00140C837E|nr:zinc-dependent metalloprotease [Motilibacter aurantiacus]NHC44284.1 zinc-dependent metalloprotease [Motilibacter aurantiacus]